jgi:hypothetical protein
MVEPPDIDAPDDEGEAAEDGALLDDEADEATAVRGEPPPP